MTMQITLNIVLIILMVAAGIFCWKDHKTMKEMEDELHGAVDQFTYDLISQDRSCAFMVAVLCAIVLITEGLAWWYLQ